MKIEDTLTILAIIFMMVNLAYFSSTIFLDQPSTELLDITIILGAVILIITVPYIIKIHLEA